jgi:anti-sigma B factor antagonist
MMQMRISETFAQDGRKIGIIPLEGHINAAAASEIRQLLNQLVGFGYPNLLIDMKKVTFMDSAGLGVLLSGLKKCRSSGGTLFICNAPESVQLVLDLSATGVLRTFSDQERAITAF